MSVEASKVSRVVPPQAVQTTASFTLPHSRKLRSLRQSYRIVENVEFIERIESFDNFYGLSQYQLSLKRGLDIVGSIVGLILFAFPMAIVALLVKLESRGPVFYGQERVGMDGRTFKMWKFRSMKTDAERSTGAIWAVEDDPRRTKLGSLLRKTSVDELPQFWNVLIGEMSLVGPRPERPVFVKEFSEVIPGYQHRHTVPVGITGLAQVYGWRGNTSLEKRVEFDLKYIREWSFLFDIRILFLTIFRGFINKNAY